MKDLKGYFDRPPEQDRNAVAAENRQKLTSFLPEDVKAVLMKIYGAIPETGIGSAVTNRIDQSNDYFMNQQPVEVAENQKQLKDFFNRVLGDK